MQITAKRGLGIRYAQQITDPLTATIPVALSRARNVLDAESGLAQANLEAVYRSNIKGGQHVKVYDELQGRSYRATVRGVEIKVSGPKITVNMSIERESYP